MMKRLYILAIVSVFSMSAVVFAQDDGPPENGTHKTYYESGALQGKVKYKNGQLNGTAKYYFENGQLAIQTSFKDGIANGTEKIYYQNGNLRRVAQFKEGVMQGVMKLYNQNGNLISEISVTDGKKEGLAKGYRSDKTVSEECNYKNDLREACTYFDKKGLIRAKSQLDPDNPKRTIYLTYDTDGKVIQAQQMIEE